MCLLLFSLGSFSLGMIGIFFFCPRLGCSRLSNRGVVYLCCLVREAFLDPLAFGILSMYWDGARCFEINLLLIKEETKENKREKRPSRHCFL